MLNWGRGEEASAGDARSELSACRMEKDYQGRRQRGRRGAGAAVLEGGGGDRERAVLTQVTQPGLQEAAGQG